MLKIKDANDKVIAVLEDESTEPVFLEEGETLEDAKKKPRKKKKSY